MKKAFTLFLALALGFGLKAQCPYTEARDFTATDIHGNEIHLFDILDNGQYVLIDFFFTTCSGCIQSIPYMVQSYPLFGCNQHDVFYIEVDYGDSESQCQNWVNTYGVEYPTIAGASGGTGICSQYGINAFPTVILIAPNHQIVVQDLWPIYNAQNIVTALESHGVQQHDCGETPIYDETLTFSADTIYVEAMELAWITVYNNTADDAIVTRMQEEPGSLMFTFDGEEMFYAFNSPEFTIPQGESIELGLYLDEVAKCITPEDITLSGNFPDASFMAVVNHPESIDENKPQFAIFPNPVNDFVTLKGENLGTVSVFNALGQKVEEFEANGDELHFGTAHYGNGVYYIRAGETVMRFMVIH